MKKLLYIGLMHGSNGFIKGLKTVFHVQSLDLSEMDKAFQISDEWKPDIVFFQIQRDGFTDVKLLRRLQYNGAFIINWSGDVRGDRPPQWFYDFGMHIDLTTFSNLRDVEIMCNDAKPADYLEIGYDPEIFTPERTGYKGGPDVVFMGNHFGHFPNSDARVDMVRSLIQNPQFTFELYGGGWPEGWARGNYMGNQIGECTVYRSAKIAINFSHFTINRYSSDRLLRIMGSGCFCLSHEWPNMDYTDGQELVTWRNLAELEQYILYYLREDDERKTIAEQGQAYVMDNHTFAHMAANINELHEKHK